MKSVLIAFLTAATLSSPAGARPLDSFSVKFWGPGLAAILLMDKLANRPPADTTREWTSEELQVLVESAQREEIRNLTPFQRQFLTSTDKVTCVPYFQSASPCLYIGHRSAFNGGGAITASCYETEAQREEAKQRSCHRILENGLTRWHIR